jgi:malonyl-CoA/methylmalonyl-CoA synthetase
MSNQNLFVALRGAFPADLDRCAVETDNGLRYSGAIWTGPRP